MKPQKNVLLTFDYELFLGKRSGTVENCLIRPTDELMRILNRHQCKGIFFVDTVYLMRLQEVAARHPSAMHDLKKITQQLVVMMRTGHFVYPHIHPHWLDASYDRESNQWTLDSLEKYRFHRLKEEERAFVFDGSVALLKEIAREAGIDYHPLAYRAGGWCLQPFSDFRPFFLKYGVQADFSVLPGYRNNWELMQFDFTGVPGQPVYRFDHDVQVHDPSGPFTEYAISCIRITAWTRFLNRFLLKYLWKTGNRSAGDGMSAYTPEAQKNRRNDEEMISIELMTSANVSAYRKFAKEKNYMHFISHPKMLSRHNLRVFDDFLNHVHRQYDVQTDFRTMTPA